MVAVVQRREEVGFDAARLTLVTLEVIGRANPKRCRKLRRKLVAALRCSPSLPIVREEAVRGVERACGRCPEKCKGV